MEAAETDGEAASGPWQPLSARLGRTQPIDQTWQEGIPAWIDHSVRDWLWYRVTDSEVRDRLFARLHFLNLDDSDIRQIVYELNERQVLDWIDGVLHIMAPVRASGRIYRISQNRARELETLLREGHSIWKVSDRYDSLERRQDATVTSAAHQATETARSADRAASATRLEEAWSAAYGLHPEPSKAFGQAILAVEAVAVPAIVPNQADATLGHVLGQLSRQGHLYELVIVDKTVPQVR